MFAECETDFKIDRHLIPYLQDVPFFAELSRHIRKTATLGIETAGVSFNPKTDELVLYFNPNFFKTLTNWQIRGVLTHEFYHLVFGHLHARIKTPPKLWNIATDLAINSIIVTNCKDSRPRDTDSDDSPLPKCGLIPGQFPVMPDGREMTKEEKEASKLGQLIEQFPPMQASEYYFNKLYEEAQKLPPGLGPNGFGDGLDTMDDHGQWMEVPEDMREYVEGRIKTVIEKAVRCADSQAQGWGNMPHDLIADIRRSVSAVVNWRAVVRQFIGSLLRGHRSTSIKRINKRYPYVHPGVKRGYLAKLLIAMDQSGSVPDWMVEMFFAELDSLTRSVTIDILPFDAAANEDDIFTWKKGTRPPVKRTKCGGTDFDAPTAVFNDVKNRGRWDGMLVMTDGECSKPAPTRQKRGWVLGKGHDIMFDTDELKIYVDKERPMSGAWR